LRERNGHHTHPISHVAGDPVRTVGTPRVAATGPRLRVDWPACKAHGLCAELLPEGVRLDEWGYPVVSGTPIPAILMDAAKRAVASCPTLALRIVNPT
jgi:ferredoxin